MLCPPGRKPSSRSMGGRSRCGSVKVTSSPWIRSRSPVGRPKRDVPISCCLRAAEQVVGGIDGAVVGVAHEDGGLVVDLSEQLLERFSYTSSRARISCLKMQWLSSVLSQAKPEACGPRSSLCSNMRMKTSRRESRSSGRLRLRPKMMPTCPPPMYGIIYISLGWSRKLVH